MQNDGKRSAPIPMTPWRNSAIPRAADSLAETPPGSANPWREREMGEMEFRLSPRVPYGWRTIMGPGARKRFIRPARVNVSDVSAWISTFRDAALSDQFENCRRHASRD